MPSTMRIIIWPTLAALAGYLLIACGLTSQAGRAPVPWDKLGQGGYVLLMPHASSLTDESIRPEFVARRCGTKVHLSDKGREEAEQLKEALRGYSVVVGRVLTSHDCRSIETAAIVFEQAEPWSIADDIRNDETMTASQKSIALRNAISHWISDKNLAVVSHQSNILQAVGVAARPAEVLVIKPLADGGFVLEGRLQLD